MLLFLFVGDVCLAGLLSVSSLPMWGQCNGWLFFILNANDQLQTSFQLDSTYWLLDWTEDGWVDGYMADSLNEWLADCMNDYYVIDWLGWLIDLLTDLITYSHSYHVSQLIVLFQCHWHWLWVCE